MFLSSGTITDVPEEGLMRKWKLSPATTDVEHTDIL
jgi:hypothetical protein